MKCVSVAAAETGPASAGTAVTEHNVRREIHAHPVRYRPARRHAERSVRRSPRGLSSPRTSPQPTTDPLRCRMPQTRASAGEIGSRPAARTPLKQLSRSVLRAPWLAAGEPALGDCRRGGRRLARYDRRDRQRRVDPHDRTADPQQAMMRRSVPVRAIGRGLGTGLSSGMYLRPCRGLFVWNGRWPTRPKVSTSLWLAGPNFVVCGAD